MPTLNGHQHVDSFATQGGTYYVFEWYHLKDKTGMLRASANDRVDFGPIPAGWTVQEKPRVVHEDNKHLVFPNAVIDKLAIESISASELKARRDDSKFRNLTEPK